MHYRSLWLVSWYPNPLSPSNGDFIQRMGWALEMPLILIHACPGTTSKLTITYTNNIHEIISFYPKKYSKTKIGRVIFTLAAYQRAIRYLVKERIEFDLIHVHVSWPIGLILLLNRKVLNRPIIVTEHWTGLRKRSHNSINFVKRALLRRFWQRTKFVLPVSQALRDDILLLAPELGPKMKVIPNVVDTELFIDGKKNVKSLKRFLFVGRIDDEAKNITGIILAFAKIQKVLPSSELVCLGDGPDKHKILTLVSKLKLINQVHCEGQVLHSEVSNWMNRSTALILFSKYENLPCVVLEALACGIPVITSETGDMHLWINNKNGIILHDMDVDTLYKAMVQVLTTTYNAKQIRNDILQKCSKKIIKDKILEIYDQCLQ